MHPNKEKQKYILLLYLLTSTCTYIQTCKHLWLKMYCVLLYINACGYGIYNNVFNPGKALPGLLV